MHGQQNIKISSAHITENLSGTNYKDLLS